MSNYTLNTVDTVEELEQLSQQNFDSESLPIPSVPLPVEESLPIFSLPLPSVPLPVEDFAVLIKRDLKFTKHLLREAKIDLYSYRVSGKRISVVKNPKEAVEQLRKFYC